MDISLKHDVKTKYIIFIFLMRSRIPKSLGWCHVLYEYYEVDSQVKQSQKRYTRCLWLFVWLHGRFSIKILYGNSWNSENLLVNKCRRLFWLRTYMYGLWMFSSKITRWLLLRMQMLFLYNYVCKIVINTAPRHGHGMGAWSRPETIICLITTMTVNWRGKTRQMQGK